MAHPRTKICAHCDRPFHRPPNGMMDYTWAHKLYCNADCKGAASEARIYGEAKHARLYCSADEVNAQIGSEALYKRMMDSYRRVAEQRGLANEWEAAVVLGMAA